MSLVVFPVFLISIQAALYAGTYNKKREPCILKIGQVVANTLIVLVSISSPYMLNPLFLKPSLESCSTQGMDSRKEGNMHTRG